MQTNEFVVLVQRGTSPEAETDREYSPIDAESAGHAKNRVLDENTELHAIAVFERVR